MSIKLVKGTRGLSDEEIGFLNSLALHNIGYDILHGKGTSEKFEVVYKHATGLAGITFTPGSKGEPMTPSHKIHYEEVQKGDDHFKGRLKGKAKKAKAAAGGGDDPDCHWVWDDDAKKWVLVGDCP